MKTARTKPNRKPLDLWLSERQVALRAKHGTPSEFAIACYEAVPEISMSEADRSIRKYLEEWNAAAPKRKIER